MSNCNVQLVGEFTLYLRVEKGLSANTILAYRSDLEQFAEVLELRHRTLFTADKHDVAAFLVHLSDHQIGEHSRSRKISSLRGLYGWLILQERLELDPTRLTITPKLPKRLPRAGDTEVVQGVISSMEAATAVDGSDVYALRDLAIFELLYAAGVRVSELCGLDERDINLRKREARVRGKGNKERIVVFGDDAGSAIEDYVKFARPHFLKSGKGAVRKLFLSEQGTGITRQRINQILAIASKGSGEHIHPHRLRHTCATDMMEGDADLRVIQEQLGHASIATTQIYTKVSSGRLHEAHAKSHPRGRKR